MTTWDAVRITMILLALFLAGYTMGENRSKLTVNLMDCDGTVRSTR